MFLKKKRKKENAAPQELHVDGEADAPLPWASHKVRVKTERSQRGEERAMIFTRGSEKHQEGCVKS